jgi:hypothetical protein
MPVSQGQSAILDIAIIMEDIRKLIMRRHMNISSREHFFLMMPIAFLNLEICIFRDIMLRRTKDMHTLCMNAPCLNVMAMTEDLIR